jgi:hypothetical protein
VIILLIGDNAMYESIEEWLKEECDRDRRITYGDSWLYWDDTASEWEVVYRPYRAKYNRTLYYGNNLNEALNALNKGME